MPKLAIIDNDPDVLRFLNLVLSPHHQVTCYATGRAALEGLLGDPPDVVLLDINLGDMSGVEVARAIRAHPRLGSVPIIAITTHVSASKRAKLTGEGFTSLVAKPIVDVESLLALVSLLISAGESLREGAHPLEDATARYETLERAASVALDALDAAEIELARATLRSALAHSRRARQRGSRTS
jgi:CheY-like chemotaxis protein